MMLNAILEGKYRCMPLINVNVVMPNHFNIVFVAKGNWVADVIIKHPVIWTPMSPVLDGLCNPKPSDSNRLVCCGVLRNHTTKRILPVFGWKRFIILSANRFNRFMRHAAGCVAFA